MEVSLLSHLTNSALVVYAIKYLRGTETYKKCVAWVPIANGKVHVLMSGIGAAATAVGMHGSVEGSSELGWHLALVIPPLWVIFHTLWDIGQQMALNQLVFAIAVQEHAAAPVITAPIAPEVTVTAPLEKKEIV